MATRLRAALLPIIPPPWPWPIMPPPIMAPGAPPSWGHGATPQQPRHGEGCDLGCAPAAEPEEAKPESDSAEEIARLRGIFGR